jgi:hypothetical protein
MQIRIALIPLINYLMTEINYNTVDKQTATK